MTNKEGEDGWVWSAPSHTVYEIQVTRPDGSESVISKRFTEFQELKDKLGTSAVANEAKVSLQWKNPDFLLNGYRFENKPQVSETDFATWTWTSGSWGRMHPDTISQRKVVLAGWLNSVLFLCPDW